MKAIQYIRWSSLKQSEGSSKARQQRILDDWCNEMGWTVSETVIDDGASGWTGENMREGELGRLSERFEIHGGHDLVLVVEQIDRLSRQDSLEVIEWFSRMVRTGLSIAMADQRMVVDRNSIRNQKQQLRHILDQSERANSESEYKSSRVRMAWQQMREEGRPVHCASTCPAWLEMDKDRTSFTIREDRADVVRQIFDLFVAGHGYSAIATMLNRQGVKTFRGGKGWRQSSVKAILVSRSVIGAYQHKSRNRGITKIGDEIQDYFPAIISNEIWEQAHNKAHRSEMGTHHGEKFRDLFSGKAMCLHCDGRLQLLQKGKRRYPTSYYACDNYQRKCGCDAKGHVRYPELERALVDNLIMLAMDDQYFVNKADVSTISAKLADQRRNLQVCGERLDNLMEELERRPSDRVRKRRDELEAEEDALKVLVKATEEELAAALGQVSPEEHVRRVSEVKGDLNSENEAVRLNARRTVKMAFNDLLEVLYVDVVTKQSVAVLKGRVRHIVIAADGSLTFDGSLSDEAIAAKNDNVIQDYYRRLKAA